ncbi:MAG: GNAT family N-acetyltransferase [Gemmataceae bacterium]|nr:GNAT family N-acetyltransferase [Gemmataceae bacterium]
MSISIRPATLADADIIAGFNVRIAAETEDKELDPATVGRGVRAILGDPNKGWYLVADRGGEVVGQLAVTFEWSDWRDGWIWWIQSVYVKTEARGQGVFRSLYKSVMSRAKAAGDVVWIRLYVEHENSRAQATYRSVGMNPSGYEVFEQAVIRNQE